MSHHFLRRYLCLLFCISSIFVFAQKNEQWQLSVQLEPELTYHDNQYSFRWNERFTKKTFNLGATASLQYNIGRRIFVEAGLGFVSRKLNAKAFVDQSLLPPPYYDSIMILYIANSIALRTLQVPLSLGVNVIRTTRINIFLKGSYIPNFLLNAKYDVNDFPAFKKNYWQGYSLNGGLGMDYRLNEKIMVTGRLGYSFKNTVSNDAYLFSQDEQPIDLPHRYLQFATGVKIDIQKL